MGSLLYSVSGVYTPRIQNMSMSLSSPFRVLSWNVQGAVPPNGSIDRIQNQVTYLEDSVGLPDIVMLNEVTTIQRERWRVILT